MSKHDHLLHAIIGKGGWFHLGLECIGDPAEHYHLIESDCDCLCESCQATDHWECTDDDRNDGDTFDGNAPCKVERGETCWVHMQDCPIEETLVGEWPDPIAWPVPVHCNYLGDGEWETRYVG